MTAGEIDVRLGATWISEIYIQRFMEDLLRPSYYASSRIKVHFSPVTAEWNISNKNSDYGNVTANTTYGTKRINEEALDRCAFCYYSDFNGRFSHRTHRGFDQCRFAIELMFDEKYPTTKALQIDHSA